MKALCTGAMLLAPLLLAGCSTPVNRTNEDSRQISVLSPEQLQWNQCEYITELTGSEGHWYTYLFYSNDTLVQGAVNELKNKAQQAGANTLVVHPPHYFVTSVTLLASAWHCEPHKQP